MEKRTLLCYVCAFLFCALSIMDVPAYAASAESGDKLFFLSPTAGIYFPTSSKTREAFGDSWEGFGVALNIDAFGGDGGYDVGSFRLYPYFGFFYADKDDNDAYVIPLGVEVRWALNEIGIVKPYVGFGISGYGIRFEDRDAGVDTGWKAAFGGRLMFGMDITKWFNVQAAYNLISDVNDYDLSGFSVQGKFKIYF